MNHHRGLPYISRKQSVACLLGVFLMVASVVWTPVLVLAQPPTTGAGKGMNDPKGFWEQNDILYSDNSCAESGSGTGSSGGSSSPGSSVAADADGWTFPVTAGTPITSDYKAPDRPDHRGVDLGAPMGSPIYAARDGTVVAAGPASGFGNWIVIQHEENGQRVDSVYGHMYDDGVMVKTGDKVTAGQQIGKVGSNGQSSGAHLHYEEWNGGRMGGSERKPVAVYGGGAAPSQTPNQNQAATSTTADNQPFAGAQAQGCVAASATSSGGPCHQPQPGEDNGKIIWDYLIGRGLTPAQAAGVMGNLRQESGPALDPGINEAVPSHAGAGFGIAQWTGGRRTELEDAAKAKGVPVNDLCFQLDYLVEESMSRENVDNPSQSEWDGLKGTQSYEEAVDYWHTNFERSADTSTGTRKQYAREYMVKYGGLTSGSART